MPRALRIQYPGAIYHDIMNRGDRRETTEDRAAVVGGDRRDVEMDRHRVAHGRVDACEQPAGASAGVNQPDPTALVSIVRTDSYTTPI